MWGIVNLSLHFLHFSHSHKTALQQPKSISLCIQLAINHKKLVAKCKNCLAQYCFNNWTLVKSSNRSGTHKFVIFQLDKLYKRVLNSKLSLGKHLKNNLHTLSCWSCLSVYVAAFHVAVYFKIHLFFLFLIIQFHFSIDIFDHRCYCVYS